MIILAPSLLSANFGGLREDIERVELAGAKYLHLDIMDGDFVPNISFGVPIIKSLRPISKMVFDVHMMVRNPERYIGDFVKAGADIINIHAEACESISNAIKVIKDLGVKSAITIKPNTPVKDIHGILDEIDMVLVMSVEPGFGGQKLIPHCLKKVENLVSIRENRGLKYDIQLDGGIDLSNLRDVLSTGCTNVVAGSSVFGAKDPSEATKTFLEIFKEFEQQ